MLLSSVPTRVASPVSCSLRGNSVSKSYCVTKQTQRLLVAEPCRDDEGSSYRILHSACSEGARSPLWGEVLLPLLGREPRSLWLHQRVVLLRWLCSALPTLCVRRGPQRHTRNHRWTPPPHRWLPWKTTELVPYAVTIYTIDYLSDRNELRFTANSNGHWMKADA